MRTVEVTENKVEPLQGMWINNGSVYGTNVEGIFTFST
jgi:hypothetical protein